MKHIYFKAFLGLLIVSLVFLLFEPKQCKDVHNTPIQTINYDSIKSIADSTHLANLKLVNANDKLGLENDSLQKLKSKIIWKEKLKLIPYNVDTCFGYLDTCIQDLNLCELQNDNKDLIIKNDSIQIYNLDAANIMYGDYLKECATSLNAVNLNLEKATKKVKRRNNIIKYLGIVLITEGIIIYLQ